MMAAEARKFDTAHDLTMSLLAVMARRRIGQEALALPGSGQVGGVSTLDPLATLSDWAPVEVRLRDISAAAKGEPAWPPLALFRALLIAVWHDLSDVRRAEALDDRASFRRFCGLAAHEPTPERTSFVRFRRVLLERGLDAVLFDEVTGQLRARAVRVKTGTLVDATVIASASKSDGEAGWAGHRSRKAVHSYKAHVGADADTAIVEAVSVTPGNVNDGRAGPSALPEVVGEVFADSAYRGPQKPAPTSFGCVSAAPSSAQSIWPRSSPNWSTRDCRLRKRYEPLKCSVWKRCRFRSSRRNCPAA